MSTKAELTADVARIRATLEKLHAIANTLDEADPRTWIQGFQIGRTKVDFRSVLDVIQSITTLESQLREARRQLRKCRQSSSAVQTHGVNC